MEKEKKFWYLGLDSPTSEGLQFHMSNHLVDNYVAVWLFKVIYPVLS